MPPNKVGAFARMIAKLRGTEVRYTVPSVGPAHVGLPAVEAIDIEILDAVRLARIIHAVQIVQRTALAQGDHEKAIPVGIGEMRVALEKLLLIRQSDGDQTLEVLVGECCRTAQGPSTRSHSLNLGPDGRPGVPILGIPSPGERRLLRFEEGVQRWGNFSDWEQFTDLGRDYVGESRRSRVFRICGADACGVNLGSQTVHIALNVSNPKRSPVGRGSSTHRTLRATSTRVPRCQSLSRLFRADRADRLTLQCFSP